MLTVKIESWSYPSGLNKTEQRSYQAHVENEEGTWIEEAPVRSDRAGAEDDAERMRQDIRERSR